MQSADNSITRYIRTVFSTIFPSDSEQAYEPLGSETAHTADDQQPTMASSSISGGDAPKNVTTETTHTVSDGEIRRHVSNDNSTSAVSPLNHASNSDDVSQGIHLLEARSTHWWSYLTTADFWIVVAIGQVLALCITATNTFTSFLAEHDTNIPAFQTVFNYILLFLIYTVIFIFRDGPRSYARTIWKDGWKYIIMAALDVEGNYFTVKAYGYTNLLSAQLFNFWAIVCVVLISFFILKVRYKVFQIVGILVCCGGMGILIASDQMTNDGSSNASDMLKGDLFALLGATLYGTSNVLEEWLVSKAPMHHVLSFIGLFGMIINGVQAAILDRHSFQQANWTPQVIGWLIGYTLCLSLFYTLAPLILRMGSAAVFDISLLTANFWGVIIGIRVFGYSVHFLYPIAFVCIILGLVTYFLSGSLLGDSKKPWLGENQERGVAGIGTAKLRAINAARIAQAEEENGLRPTASTKQKTTLKTFWEHMRGKDKE